MNNEQLIKFEIFFRSIPLILLFFNLINYWWFKHWLKGVDLNQHRKKVLLIYKFFIFIFITPWFFLSYIGPGGLFLPSLWLKIIYVFPSYIWQLTNFALFFILVPYYLVKGAIYLFHWIYEMVKHYIYPIRNKIRRKIEVDHLKRHFLTKSAIAIPGLILCVNFIGVYGSEFDYVVNKLNFKIKNLPERLKGLTITQISDLHFGPFFDENKFAYMLDDINGLKSDIIMITGDIIHSSPKMIPAMKESFSSLKANEGIYACMGNHEYYAGPQATKKGLEDIGIEVLVDQSKLMNINESQIYLLGIDYPNNGAMTKFTDSTLSKHITKMMKGVQNEIPKVLMAHHPDTFKVTKNLPIELTLSGHTHGGQVVLGEVANKKLALGQLGYQYLKGHYQESENHLYVNSGLGHWLPVRVNCPPEITQITLE